MCGLFGFTHYGNNEIKNLQELTNALAVESAVRGTDATGVAYNNDGKLNIVKDAKSAYALDFKHADSIKVLIGHTRHSTQGSEKQNRNNHPFLGFSKNTRFALAHNGVLINDAELKEKYRLPKSKIETDSYVAVQLLEHQNRLDETSIKFMAEAVNGSFSFSILDHRDNLYLVKGDSPLHILHFPKLNMYVYASTECILWKALVDTNLFDELNAGRYEQVPISCGDILKIASDGKLSFSKFEYRDYNYGRMHPCYWWDYGFSDKGISKTEKNTYIQDLKIFARYNGYDDSDVDALLAEGFSLEEIEEMVYCGYEY